MLQDLNNIVPLEVLEEIFRNLDLHDLSSCLFVSKSWHLTAQELLKNGIPVYVYESELSRLLEDIPSLGYKVKSITLKDQPGYTHGRKANSLIFKEIYIQCPNIVSLYFEFTNIFHYLDTLLYSKADLSLLDNIDIDNFSRCPLRTQELYAYLHCFHTKSFKSFSMAGGNNCWEHGWSSGGDLVIKVSRYPKLTTFKILGENLKRNTLRIDLINMFERIPRLQEVIIQQVRAVISGTPPDSEVAAHPQATKLSLKTSEMDLKSLKYIVSHLKKVKYLYLDIDKLMPDTPLSENETRLLFNDLISHTIGIKKLYIRYFYSGVNYYLENGQNYRIEPVEGYEAEEEVEEIEEIVEGNVLLFDDFTELFAID